MLNTNNLIAMMLKKLKWPLYILIACYLISLLCAYYRNTYIGNILIVCIGEDGQLLLIAYGFFVISFIKQLCKIFIISENKAIIMGVSFYAIVSALYAYTFSFEDDFVVAIPLLRTLFYGFLGAFFGSLG